MTPRTPQEVGRGSLFAFVGWLFADLLLMLAMLFLVANTVGVIKPPPPPTPTPTTQPAPPTNTPLPTPTSTQPPLPCLEQTSVNVRFAIAKTAALASGDTATEKQIADQIVTNLQQQGKQGRRAGFVIISIGSGGPGDSNVGYAASLGDNVIAGLKMLESSRTIFFNNPTYYKPLVNIYGNVGDLSLDVYLYALPGQCQRT